jgi:peptide/nickel transport system substrate-binding protein
MASSSAHSRRPFVFGALAAIAVLAAAAALILRVSGKDEEGGVLAPRGSTYVEGVAGTWQRINPIYASSNEVDADLSALIFATLLTLGPDGQVHGGVAELPDVSDGGRVYTFHLKPNLRWHDGTALTARDVAFTISRITDPDFKGDAALAESWANVEVETPDLASVILKLRQPSAPFLARNGRLGILPEHLLAGLSAAELFESPFNAAPVGAGPYRLESLDSHEARLVAYPGYHFGRPEIEQFEVRFYSDYPTALRALQAGELNGLMLREPPTPTQLAEIAAVKGVRLQRLQRSVSLILYLNNDQAQLFQDERVRRALSLALDRVTVVQRTMQDAAIASSSIIPPATWAYVSAYDTTMPDVEEAKRLLDEAGWKAHPTTGILVKEGTEFRFTIRTDNDPVRVAVAGEIARQFADVGIRATVASTVFSVLRRDFLQERRYDAALAGWEQGPDPDPYFGWHSSQMGAAGLNIANFADLVADELIAKGRTTVDEEVRAEQYRQFQEVWEELSPSLVIAYAEYLYVQANALKLPPYGVLFDPAARFNQVQQWKP